MLRAYTVLLVSLTSCAAVWAQLSLDWAFSTGSAVSDLTSTMQSDHADNLYVMSVYRATVDLDPGVGQDIIIPEGLSVTTLSKYTSEGQYQWSGLFWDESEIAGGIFEIKNNKMRLALTFHDSLNYQLNGQFLIQISRPGQHLCLLDLTLEGQVLSTYYIAQPSGMYLTSVVSVADYWTFIGGSFMDTLVFSDQFPLVSLGGFDPFVALLDENLETVWVTSCGSTMNDYLTDINYDRQGRIYFSFIHDGEVELETYLQGQLVFPSSGDENSVFGFLDEAGKFINAFALGGESYDEIYSITSDDLGNMYICGTFEGTVNFAHPSQPPVMYTAAHDSDGFVAKYTPGGLLLWAGVFRTGDYGFVNSIVLKRDSEIYLAGGVTGWSDLDPGPDSIMVNADFKTDVFITKLNLDGELLYSYHFPGNEVEGIRTLHVSTGFSKVFAHGFFYDSLDCDFTDNIELVTSAGGSDVFIIGFNEDNVISGTSPVAGPEILVYPNPFSGELYIESSEMIRSLDLMTIDGHVLDQQKNIEHRPVKLNLGWLTPGIYVLRTQTDSGHVISRIIRD